MCAKIYVLGLGCLWFFACNPTVFGKAVEADGDFIVPGTVRIDFPLGVSIHRRGCLVDHETRRMIADVDFIGSFLLG